MTATTSLAGRAGGPAALGRTRRPTLRATGVRRARRAGVLALVAVLLGSVPPVAPPAAGAGIWEPLGGPEMVGEPAAASWGAGRLDVVVRSRDGRLHRRWFESGWSRWQDLGTGATSSPAIAAWGPGRLDVFVRGAGNRLRHRFKPPGGAWSPWTDLGGTLGSAPTVASWGPGRLDVFARGLDGQLVHRAHDPAWGGWGPWEALGGRLVGAPAVVAGAPGRLDVFVRGTDGGLHARTYADGWWGWAPLGGVLTAPPGATSTGPGILEVAVRGVGGGVFMRRFLGGAWRDWVAVGGNVTGGVAAVSWGRGRIDLFARGTDLQLWHTWDERVAVGNGPPPPAGSGWGRRIVYCNSCQRAWHVEADGSWYTFLVSGRLGVPAAGTYRVHRKIHPGSSGNLRLPYFVGFAWGRTADIGFHGIPLRPDGTPVQRDDELGQPRSAGCVRVSQSDALRTWHFAQVGSVVVVTP